MKVKEKYGLVYSAFFPIASMPENAHPVYGPEVDMGAAVKAYLSMNFAEAQLYGDDVLQLEVREFTGGQLDAETLLNDLEIESKLFGSQYSAGVATDNKNDAPNEGGYGYIQKLKTPSGTVYRGCFLYRVGPRMSADNSDTKNSSITFANNAVTYSVMVDNVGDWRSRQDLSSEAAAKAFIRGLAKAASGGAFAVKVNHVGTGSSNPGPGTVFVTAGGGLEIIFAADPVKLYDGVNDVTASISGHKYTVSNVSADHIITAIFAS